MRRVIMLVIAVVGMSIAIATPTRDTAGISLSGDGISWGTSLSRPVFEESTRWVPGDVRTAEFFIRSDAPTPGRLEVDLLTQAQGEMTGKRALQIEARIADGAWQPATDFGRVGLFVDSVEPGAKVRVEVRVGFSPKATNRTKRLQVSVHSQISLQPTRARRESALGYRALSSSGGGSPVAAGFTLAATILAFAGWRQHTRRKEVALDAE